MTPEFFITQFPGIAERMSIGFTTTVEYNGKAYSFRKIGPGQFINVTRR